MHIIAQSLCYMHAKTDQCNNFRTEVNPHCETDLLFTDDDSEIDAR